MKETFGTLLLPMATKITKAITSMAEALNALSPEAKKATLVVAGIVAVAGPLLLMLGAIGLALPIIGAGFALLFSPITLIIAAIGGAVAAFLWLKSNWVDVSNVIGGTIEQIGINFSLLWKSVKDGFISFIDFFMPAINNMLLPITKLMQFGSFIGGKAFELFGNDEKSKAVQSQAAQASSNVVKFPTVNPQVVTANANASLSGEIKVSASKGSQVDSISSQSSMNGSSANLGLGLAG